MHVYSPGVKGYKAIELTLHPMAGIEMSPAVYPTSKNLYLEAIREQVPVFEGRFHITQDVTVTPSKTRDAVRSVLDADKSISITGELKYQACDRTLCYSPTALSVKMGVAVQPLDLKRSPKAIQHRVSSE